MHLLADGHLLATLLVDDHIVPFLAGQTWLWNKRLQRAYRYVEGKQQYLSTFIAEHSKQHGVTQVRFAKDVYDYRIEALEFKESKHASTR